MVFWKEGCLVSYFEQWTANPLSTRPIAHAIWDPHFGEPAVSAYSYGNSPGPVNISTSGVYQWWYTIGLRTNQDLFQSSIFLVILSAVFLFAGWLHTKEAFQPSLSWFKNAESRLNHHLSGLFGVSSLAWTGHLIHVAIPELRGTHVRFSNFLTTLPHPQGLVPFFTGNWGAYAGNADSSDSILTFIGGLNPETQSLYLTDIAHHHLAIAVLFILAGHQYRTNFGIGHSIKEILDTHTSPQIGNGHKGLYDTINNSLHFQLALALAAVGTITSLVAQHQYALPPYAYIAQDYVFCFNIVSSETIKFSCLFCLIKRNSKLHRPVVFKSIDDEVDNSLPNYKNNFSGISNGEKDESFSNHENDPNKEILDDEDEEDSSLPNYENYSIETPSKGTDFTGFFLPGLYGIVNIKTNKIYIGQSYNLASRLSDHMRNLSQSTHSSIKL